MKKKDWIISLLLILLYLSILFLLRRDIFFYKFDQTLIKRYFLSQDIPHEVAGKRLFLSDAEIYEATGYLYATGRDPIDYNFEHPPLIKYFFGFSTVIFNNPYFAQILLGVFFLLTFYFFGKKIYKNSKIAFIACLLIMFDPLFLDISSSLLLDLGQVLFLLLYILAVLYYKKDYAMQGIFLALFAGTKFWVTPLFFIFFLGFYLIYKKEFVFKYYLLHILTALIIFTCLYLKTIYDRGGSFNIFFHMLKIFKYRFHHNTSSFFGSSIILFTTGYLKSWWGKKDFIRQELWSLIWPITLVLATGEAVLDIVKKTISDKTLIRSIPLLYLLYLGVQATPPRYFMIILPFCYLIFASRIYNLLPFDRPAKK